MLALRTRSALRADVGGRRPGAFTTAANVCSQRAAATHVEADTRRPRIADASEAAALGITDAVVRLVHDLATRAFLTGPAAWRTVRE